MTDRELLEIIAAQVQHCAERQSAIELLLERLAPPPKSASQRDYRILQPLLPQSIATFSDLPFQAVEIIEDPRLRLIVSSVIAGKERPVQALGQFLKRCAGVRIKGQWVQCEGESRGVALWTVREVRLVLPTTALEAA